MVTIISAKQSEKNEKFYVVLNSPTKGFLGQNLNKFGSLEFETEAEMKAAVDTIEAAPETIGLGKQIANTNFHEVVQLTPANTEVEQSA